MKTSRLLQLAILYFLFAWLAFNTFETIREIVILYVPIPVADYWRVVENLQAYKALHLAAFWRQHNEHRIIFPEIVFAFDIVAAHGRFIVPLVVSVLSYAAGWGILSIPILRDSGTPLFGRLCAILLAGVLAFWEGSALAIAQPFLLQWTLMQCAVILALFFLTKFAAAPPSGPLAATIIAAVIATYSSGNALLIWPLLIGIALALRIPKRSLAILVVSGIVFTSLYFVGYKSTSHTNVGLLLAHPGMFIQFVAIYLSMPFSAIKSPAFGTSIGLINFAVVVLLAIRAWRARLLATPPAIILFGYYVFALLTMAVTASGRLDPADTNFGAARVARYVTVPMLNWGAVFLLCLWLSARLRWRIFNPAALTVALALLFALGTYKLRSWRETNSDQFAVWQLAALHFDTGLADSQIIERIFPSPEFVQGYLPALKNGHLALFSRRHDEWLGKSITQFGPLQSSPAPGEISYIFPIEHGLEVVGWTFSNDVRNPFPRIFLANEKGQIVGWGRRPAAGFPADLITARTPEHEAWVAFVNLAIPSRTISAYAAIRRGLTPIEGVITVPSYTAAAPSEVGPPIPNISWQMDKAWALNGIPNAPKYGWLPSSDIYSSWQSHDEHTGRITADFLAPQNACVVLPILHGPSIGGASAQLIDVDSGAVIAELPFRNHDDLLWSIWRVSLPSGAKHLRYIATDNGRDWGQWLAVSAPSECK